MNRKPGAFAPGFFASMGSYLCGWMVDVGAGIVSRETWVTHEEETWVTVFG